MILGLVTIAMGQEPTPVPPAPAPAVVQPADFGPNVDVPFRRMTAIVEAADGEMGPFHYRRLTVNSDNTAFCDTSEPGSVARTAFCVGGDVTAYWKVSAAHEGDTIRGRITMRRFDDPAELAAVKNMAIARYGGGKVGVPDGAFSWCYAVVSFQADVMWTLEYGCHVSNHVTWMMALEKDLVSHGDVLAGKATAVLGRHSGWSYLVDATGEEVVLEPAQRRTQFVRVVDVKKKDTLSVRDSPPDHDGTLADKIGELPPDAACVPLVYAPKETGWWKVMHDGGEGWASSRYLRRVDASTCLTPTE